jgi:palmitoyltransferase
MGIATSFVAAAVGFHSKGICKQFFIHPFKVILTSQCDLMPGLWTEPVILSSSESWTHFMFTNHPGAVLFMFLDVFLLTGALILTGAQAVQVIVKCCQ